MKTVFSCDECGYRYAKAWYEPMWLARRQYEPEHPNVHNEWAYAMANPNSNPIAQSWVRAERERIIANLRRDRNKLDVAEDIALIDRVIARIEAENK